MTTSQENEQGDQAVAINPALIGWGVAALVITILALTFNNSAMVLGAGFGAKLLAFLVGSVLGWIGALIGDAIRRFAHPDAVWTSGGMTSLIWIKVFWAIGPQVIGLVSGVAAGCSMILR